MRVEVAAGLLLSGEVLFCPEGTLKTITWAGEKVQLIDQTRLPFETVILEYSDYRELARAIEEMRVRGAPAIGVAAAYAVALGARAIAASDRPTFLDELVRVCERVRATRPTAVNLFCAVERLWQVAQEKQETPAIQEALLAEAQRMEAEDEAANRRLGQIGAELLPDPCTALTHCNAGALATVAYGTALGVIRAAHEQGKRLHVFVDETRPRLQGALLTAWELQQEGIPFTLIADTMAGHFIQKGAIDCIIVGADRIAANGDVANKIGTYQLAVLAKENGVPFYVAAPTSTIDLSLSSGDGIPIEERSAEEVTHVGGVRIVPEGTQVANPAFDVTPHRYVAAIITEQGVFREPYAKTLATAFEVSVAS